MTTSQGTRIILTNQEHLIQGDTSEAMGIRGLEWYKLAGVSSGEISIEEAIKRRSELGYANISPIVLVGLGMRRDLVFKFEEIDSQTGISIKDPTIGIWDNEKNEVISHVDGVDLANEVVERFKKMGVDLHLRERPIRERERPGSERYL